VGKTVRGEPKKGKMEPSPIKNSKFEFGGGEGLCLKKGRKSPKGRIF